MSVHYAFFDEHTLRDPARTLCDPPASGNTVNKQKRCDPRRPYATPRIKLGMRAARVPNATPRITYATAQAALIQIDMPNV